MLRLAVQGEIEDLAADLVAAVEVAIDDHHLVADALGHGDDLARRRDDGALADQVAALLPARLGDAHHPIAVLVAPACMERWLWNHIRWSCSGTGGLWAGVL